MSSNRKRTARLLTAVLGAGLAGATLSGAHSAGADPLQCEIHVAEHGSTVDLQAMVLADAAAEGTYEFSVSGGGADGSSDIAQSGEFSVEPGTRSPIGSVTLASTGGTYIAKLLVTAGGHSSRCTKRIVGSL
jgi:hypothetical protein